MGLFHGLGIIPKMTLVFVFFAAALLAGVGALAYTSGRSALEAAIISGLLSTATEKEAALNAWIEERATGLTTLVNTPALHEAILTFTTAQDPASVETAHRRLVRELQSRVGPERQYLSFWMMDSQTGRVTVASDPGEEGKFKKDSPYFINGQQGPYVQNASYPPDLPETAMIAAVPLRSAQGQLLGVLAGQLNPAKLEAIVSQRTGLHQTDEAFLVNSASLFFTPPRFVSDPAVLRQSVHDEAVQRCLTSGSGAISAEDYRGVPAITVYRWLAEHQLCLIVKIDRAEALAPAHAFGQTLLLTGGLALGIASLVGLGLARTITRPVRALQAGAARLGRGDLAARLSESSGDELGQLAREFNTMAAALMDQEAQLRRHADELEQLVQERTATLRESEQRFATAFRASPSGLVISRLADGQIIEVNQSWLELFGYSRAEVMGQSSLALNLFVNPADRQRAVAQIQGQGYLRDFELEIRRKSGEIRQISMSVELIEINNESGLLTIINDITERKRAEQALRESEERFRATFEQAAVGIAHIGLDARWLRINQKLCDIVGYSREALLEKTFQDITHPEDLETDLAYRRQVLAGANPAFIEKRYIRQDGSIVWTNLTVSLVREPSGEPNYFITVIEDITQRKNLEERFHQAQKMEAIGRLSGGVAHDFNNMLVVINGYSELLLQNLLPQGDPMRWYVEEIEKAGQRAAALTNQLLAFSRRQVLQPQILNLNEVVANMETMLRRLIGEHIELKTISGQGLGWVKADPGQLEQVLVNLVVNARDALPYGGHVIIETSQVELDEISARRQVELTPGSYVMLAVSDTGMGMDAETRSHIFEPFFTTKESGKGTGLGLASVYGIVKQSGGDIWVHSQPDRGTTFKIYLPRIEEAASTPEPRPDISKLPVGTETVLLVEDEEDVRQLARRVLEMSGYTVLEASYGAEALRLYDQQTQPIHLLLSDIVMPGGMNGQKLAERLTSLHPGLKVLLMSGYINETLTPYGVLEPDWSFLQKPFTPHTLLRKVREVLA